jgi:predicted MPP superfamily phosphohydrolase
MKMTKKRRHIGIIILLLLILLISILLIDSNTRIVVNEYPLHYSNLPAAFDGYRIVQLSDIHAVDFGKENEGLIDAVKKAQPDMIAITGDLVNNDDDSDYDLGIIRPLIKSLVTIAPVYYVTGNHEWDSGWVRELLKMLGDNGVTVLRNDYERLYIGKDSIILAGIDDPNGPADMISPEAFLSQTRMNEGDTFIMLLAHRNNYLNRLSGQGVDLILCGHAHGGLIRLPLIGGLVGPSRELFPNFTSGIYTDGNTKMLVSRGIGNHTGIPRFLNNPEIPVIILKQS